MTSWVICIGELVKGVVDSSIRFAHVVRDSVNEFAVPSGLLMFYNVPVVKNKGLVQLGKVSDVVEAFVMYATMAVLVSIVPPAGSCRRLLAGESV